MISRVNTALLMVAAGALIGLISVSQSKVSVPPNVQRAQDLSGIVNKLEQENEALIARIDSLNEQMRGYESSLSDNGEIAAQVKASLTIARMEAGLVALTGPGLVVEVDNLPLTEPGQYVKVVQDEDLLAIVNELNAAGAEAVSINGERIISISEIRSAGSHININTRAQAAPYTILAIGNPETLSAAMNLYGGVIDTFSKIVSINTWTSDKVDIPAYQGVINYRWAQIAE